VGARDHDDDDRESFIDTKPLTPLPNPAGGSMSRLDVIKYSFGFFAGIGFGAVKGLEAKADK